MFIKLIVHLHSNNILEFFKIEYKKIIFYFINNIIFRDNKNKYIFDLKIRLMK